MAMRLNAAMKQQVVGRAIKATFDKRFKDIYNESLYLGDAMLDFLQGSAKKAIKAAAEAGFCYLADTPHEGTFNVVFSVAGQQVPLNVSANRAYPTKGGHYYRNTNESKGTINDQTLVNRCRAWQGVSEDTKKARAEAKATLEAMLKNIQTYERLAAEWPQGKKFYASLPADFPYQHQVPAVQVSKLNEMLGIAA